MSEIIICVVSCAGIGEYDVMKRGKAPATELAPGMHLEDVSHREAALARRRGRSIVSGSTAAIGSGSSPETSPTKTDPSQAHQQQIRQQQSSLGFGVGAPPAAPSVVESSNTGPAPFATREFTSPYLLLDVRDPDEYDRCHVISGVHQPQYNIYNSRYPDN